MKKDTLFDIAEGLTLSQFVCLSYVMENADKNQVTALLNAISDDLDFTAADDDSDLPENAEPELLKVISLK